jgi:hypothetical protein
MEVRSSSRPVPGWALVVLFGLVLALAGGVVVMAVQMEQSADAVTKAEQLATQRAWEADLAAAREEAAREAAAEAALEEAALEEAAREEAAREEAARKNAAREEAAREAAREAAAEEAAREEAAGAEVATHEEAPSPRVITGDITVPDINGALITQVGGYPGQPLNTLDMSHLNKMGALLNSLERGKTYPCPQGSGGGFGDLVVGAQVTVLSGDGAVLATGSLTGGRVNLHGCTFTYRLTVPDSEFYRIEVSHRGALTFSRADLAAEGWHVSARL